MKKTEYAEMTVVGNRPDGKRILAHGIARDPAYMFAVSQSLFGGVDFVILKGHAQPTNCAKVDDIRELALQAFAKDADDDLLKEYLAWCEQNRHLWAPQLDDETRERIQTLGRAAGYQDVRLHEEGPSYLAVEAHTDNGARIAIGVITFAENGTWQAGRYSPKAYLVDTKPLAAGYRVISEHVGPLEAFMAVLAAEQAGVVSTELSRPEIDENLLYAFERRLNKLGLNGIELRQERGVQGVVVSWNGQRRHIGYLRRVSVNASGDFRWQAMFKSPRKLPDTVGYGFGFEVISDHAAPGAAFQAVLDALKLSRQVS